VSGLGRLVQALPRGTVTVGAGLGVLGLASYVHLAAAGHVLDDADMSSLSVLWSIVFAVGLGLFVPVEQEMARLVAAGRSTGPGARVVLARGAAFAGGAFGLLLAAIVLLRRPIADRLFAGDVGLVWALAGALGALAVAHTTRGVFAGRGRFGWYGVQLGIDGGLRILLALAFFAGRLDSTVWFSLILTLAPVASVLLTLPAVVEEARSAGPPASWRAFARGLGLLTVSSLAAQLLVNVAVVNARILDPEDVAIAAALLSATVLVRIPLFVFASLQASLLPSLSQAVADGDEAGFRRQLTRGLAAVTVLGGAGAVVAVPAGPWLSVLLFDAPDVLGAADFAWLALGTLAYLWAMVLGQGVLARGHHHQQTSAWVVGLVVLAAVTLLPGSVALRVELGYAAGSAATAALLAYWLTRRAAR
jgi:O-antigen/teichoic acid export membrane protein